MRKQIRERSFVDDASEEGLANERDVDRTFALDSDFQTPGLTRVPIDTGEATR